MVVGTRDISVFCLNMVQGLPASFFAIGLPALMREAGAGLDLVSLAYLVWAPWALKWLWAPLLDGRPNLFNAVLGRITDLPLMMAGVFVVLVALPPSGSGWSIFVVGIACSFVGSTLQMVLARWIMAVEPSEERRARLNATQVAGMVTGAMVGGTSIVALSAWLSWSIAVLIVAFLIVLAGLPFLLTQQDDFVAERPTGHPPIGSSFARAARSFFGRPGIGALMGLMLMSDVATGVDILLTARLVDQGYSATQATFLLNTIALAITIPAAVLAGSVLQRFRALRTLPILLVAKATIYLLLATDAVPGSSVAGLAIASVVTSSVIAVAYWQVNMRFAIADFAASDIGMLTSIRTLFILVGGIGAGQVSGALGYAGIFGVAAAMALVAAMIAHVMETDRRKPAP